MTNSKNIGIGIYGEKMITMKREESVFGYLVKCVVGIKHLTSFFFFFFIKD